MRFTTSLASLMLMLAFSLTLSSMATAETLDEAKQRLEGPLKKYRDCVFPNAVRFAKTTKESAEAIRQASIASCYRERDQAMDGLRSAGLGDPDIRDMDAHVNQQIYLAIVNARAQ